MIAPELLFPGAATCTAILMYPIRFALRIGGVLDYPNARSSHSVAIIRGGGVGIVLVTGVLIAIRSLWAGAPGMAWILPAFIALAIVSFIDDLRGVGVMRRFMTHIASAAMALTVVILYTPESLSSVVFICVSIGIYCLWIVAYTNAYNFMDGINGIAALQAVITGLGTAAIALSLGLGISHPAIFLALAVASSALGFLPHNFPKPRVFMGDVGSATIGFLLAVTTVWIARATQWWVLVWLALLHANFILDTTLTLIRRAARGERLHEAHREHFYQRLVRAGWGHTAVTLAETGMQVLVALVLWVNTKAIWPVKLVVGASVIAAWLALFVCAESIFRKSQAGRAAMAAGH